MRTKVGTILISSKLFAKIALIIPARENKVAVRITIKRVKGIFWTSSLVKKRAVIITRRPTIIPLATPPTTNPIIIPTGLSATSSVGSLTPADVMGLTGVSTSLSVGSLAPADQVMGLTGVLTTSRLGLVTTIPIYGNVDTGSNSSYSGLSTGSNSSFSGVSTGSNITPSAVSTGSNSSISDVATGSNTSYTDAA